MWLQHNALGYSKGLISIELQIKPLAKKISILLNFLIKLSQFNNSLEIIFHNLFLCCFKKIKNKTEVCKHVYEAQKSIIILKECYMNVQSRGYIYGYFIIKWTYFLYFMPIYIQFISLFNLSQFFFFCVIIVNNVFVNK